MNREVSLKYIKYIFCTLLTLIGFVACHKSEVYYDYHEVKSAKWSKLDTLVFEVDSTRIVPGEPYSVSLEITHNMNYPYRNIWFYVTENILDSNYSTHGKQFMLADEFGKWHGAGFGALYQISLKYFDDIRFKEKRNYRVKIVHGMRDEPLGGIEKVGLKITQKERQDN